MTFEEWWEAYDSKHLYISTLRGAFQSGAAAEREAIIRWLIDDGCPWEAQQIQEGKHIKEGHDST